MKNYKGARLKTFNSEEEAREFTLNGGDKEKIPPVQPVNDAKAPNFKAPKPQELVAFRKLIESGDLEAVKNIVWENPRYLVSSGDTPAILQVLLFSTKKQIFYRLKRVRLLKNLDES